MSDKERLDLTLAYLALFVLGASVVYSAGDADVLFCSENAAKALHSSETGNCLEFWLNRYQTLIGAIVALIAAVIGFKAIRHQTEQTNRIEENKLKRANLAARSTMPLALNSICEYAEACVQVFEADRTARAHAGGTASPPPNLPVFPQGAIEPLRRAVEFSQLNEATAVADILATAQVFLARTRDSRWARRPSSELQDRMLDALDLYTRASNLFEYAREGIMDRNRVTSESIRTALHLFRINIAEWPLLQTRLRLMEESEAGNR
jgi:hypothetical protein